MMRTSNQRCKYIWWIFTLHMHWAAPACMECRLYETNSQKLHLSYSLSTTLPANEDRTLSQMLEICGCLIGPLHSQSHWQRWLTTPWAIFLSLLCACLHVTAKVTASYLLHWGLPPTSKQGRSLSGQSGRTSCEHLGVGGNLAAFHWAGQGGGSLKMVPILKPSERTEMLRVLWTERISTRTNTVQHALLNKAQVPFLILSPLLEKQWEAVAP